MNYQAFNDYLNAIENTIQALEHRHSKAAKKTFDHNGRWALNQLEAYFKDKHHNLCRWLNGTPCLLVQEKTGAVCEIDLGRDREAIYLFLMLGKKMSERKEISSAFREYLEYVINRSRTPETDWEEC